MNVQVRIARGDDVLATIWDEALHAPFNPDQVLVAEDGGKLVGGLIFVDGGHPMIVVENVRIHASGRRKLTIFKQLISALFAYARARGAVLFEWMSPDNAFTAMLLRAGCKPASGYHYLVREVTSPLPWERHA